MKMTARNAMVVNGFSLIEVLVALFVLAVGVTGVIAMQLTALRTTQQMELRSRALYLASEMADSVRNNTQQMQYEDASNPYLQMDDEGQSASPSSSSSTLVENCYQSDRPCDANQLAQFYIAEWLSRLHAALPGGRARICRDDDLIDKTTDQIRWSCNEISSTAPLVIKVAWQKKSEGKDDPDVIDHSLSVIGLMIAAHAK